MVECGNMNAKAKRLGFLVNTSNSDYINEIKQGILQACGELGAALFVFCIDNLDFSSGPFSYQQKTLTAFCTRQNLDGLIIAGAVFKNHASRESFENFLHSFKGIPLVIIGARLSGFHSVVADQKAGLKKLLDDLVKKHGCRRFGIIGKYPDSDEVLERTETIAGYLKKQGISFSEKNVIEGTLSYHSAMEGLKKHYKKNGALDFDALMALNDEMAFAAIDFCRQKKIRVPEDIHITGFDNVNRASLSNPPLTSVSQHLAEQGKKSVQVLLDLIKKKDVPEVTEISSTAHFRSSCGCAGKTKKQDFFSALGNSFYDVPAEWLEKREQFHMVNRFYSECQIQMNLNGFCAAFPDMMRNFDINAAAVVLYDEPVYLNERLFHFNLPVRASVPVFFDDSRKKKKDLSKAPRAFNPQKALLPAGLIDFKKGEYSVRVLSNCENQYGYVLYRAGNCDRLVYSMAAQILSNVFYGAYKKTMAEREAKKQAERNAVLNHISNTDELTGLLNRRGFMELGQQTIDISLALNQGGVVVFGDMDGLKDINDSYGHDAGDRAIRATAEILRKNFRASDIVGRLGGDEFVAVAAGLGPRLLTDIRKNIDTACKAWNILNDEDFELSISLGCVEYSRAGSDINALLKQADELLYREKRKKKKARRKA